MDWYLIDGLMNDYLLCTHVEDAIMKCCVDYLTADIFYRMADDLDYE